MKLKHLITALSLGFAAISASATPLDQISGSLNVKLTGLTTESNTYAAPVDPITHLPVAKPAGSGYETTWGIGNITEIRGTGGQRWVSGVSDGSYLYYMIYGIADLNVVPNGGTGTFNIYNVGATKGDDADGKIHLDVYRSNVDLLSVTSDFNASPGQRTGFDTYSLFAGMEQYLQLEFATGKQLLDVLGGTNPGANETLSTLVQTATSATLPAAGEGQFFAEVVGGTAKTQWDTNGLFGHDMDGKFTLSTNGAKFGSGTCTTAQVASNACFTGLINDPIRANKVPEPGSLALLGLGFAGLAGLRRRRSAK